MRGIAAYLPIVFGGALVVLAGAVDRSLARLARSEEASARAEVAAEQQRATLQLTTSLQRIQNALVAGETMDGARAWSVARPPSPAASGAAPPVGTDRASLALRLSSVNVTPNGLPEAVVAALALGDAALMRSAGEALALGRLPVRAEDVATLGSRLGMGADPRLGVLEQRLRALPPSLPRRDGWSWSLRGDALEGWGSAAGRVLHADIDARALTASAGLDERALIVPRDRKGAREFDAVAGAAVVVAPDESGPRRLLAWRAVAWTFALLALTLSMVQARLMRREAALVARERAFVANVTHELRTPLAALRALGETLAAGRGEPGAYGGLVADEARRLEVLVERVLAAARAGEKPRLAECAPHDVVRSALDLVRSRAERREVTLVENIAAEIPAARWDEDAVRGAVANLLENAVKHGRERGRVEVSARLHGERVAICVKDDGPGIARQQRRRLFRRFERGTTDAPGTGLGLSLVEQVASAHGGSVDLQSRPGEGCTFTLLLPLRAAA